MRAMPIDLNAMPKTKLSISVFMENRLVSRTIKVLPLFMFFGRNLFKAIGIFVSFFIFGIF